MQHRVRTELFCARDGYLRYLSGCSEPLKAAYCIIKSFERHGCYDDVRSRIFGVYSVEYPVQLTAAPADKNCIGSSRILEDLGAASLPDDDVVAAVQTRIFSGESDCFRVFVKRENSTVRAAESCLDR